MPSERLSALRERLARAASAGPKWPTIKPDPARRFEPFPLTPLQQAYWIGSFNPDPKAGISFLNVERRAPDLDIDRLAAAWRRLVERHDLLKAFVRPDGLWQVLEDAPPFEVDVIDLRGASAEEVGLEIERIREELNTRLRPDSWPLFAVYALRCDDAVYTIQANSLILSGWFSAQIIEREGSLLYRDPQAELRPLELSFRDYALAMEQLAKSERYEESVRYWLERISDDLTGPVLPTVSNGEAHWHRISWWIPNAQFEMLEERARAARLKPAILLLAAYAEVIAAWSEQRRFMLIIVTQLRLPLHPQITDIIGNTGSTMPVVVDFSEPGSFASRARELQSQIERDVGHYLVGGVELSRLLSERRGVLMPMSSVAFNSGISTAFDEGGWMGQVEYANIQTPNVALDNLLQRSKSTGDISILWEARGDLFPDGMLDEMGAAYKEVLERLATDESAWSEARPIRAQPTNDDGARRPAVEAALSEQLLHQPILEQVARHSNREAVITPERTLTYGELYRRSNAFARRLRDLDLAPGELVAVVMEKGWEQIVAALAILEAGGAYLPIDAAQTPQDRLTHIIEASNARLVLTQPAIDSRYQWPARAQVQVVHADDPGVGLAPQPLAPLQKNTDLAYVIYTSGSTGNPKGVMIDHRGALNTCVDINQRLSVGPGDRALGLSSLAFDLSVYDIFGLLGAGGALVIPGAADMRDPAAWASLARDNHVTIWNSVPKIFEMLVDFVGNRRELWPDSLRVAMLSGDWIPVPLADRARAIDPDLSVISLGGATEGSIWSIIYPIGEVDPDWASIPYGEALTNQSMHVLDSELYPRPVWVPGELYIGGTGVARGYWNDPERTAAAFFPHPVTGERLYRTGDWGRLLPDGNLEFLGRRDAQVKVRGYRVELGEIENILCQATGVKECYVALREANPRAAGARRDREDDTPISAASGSRAATEKVVVAYVVPESAGHELDEADLRAHASQFLPPYMMPTAFVQLDAIPLSANGKVDRRALPAMNARDEDRADRTAPRTELEAKIAAIWEDFLGVEQVGVDESFFDLGGDSVRTVRLLVAVREQLGCEVELAAFLADPTVSSLARLARDGDEGGVHRRLLPIAPDRDGLPLFLVHPVSGNALVYLRLVDQTSVPLFAFQAAGLDSDERPVDSVEDLAERYLEELAAVSRDGPVLLGGWSLGGVVAFEMAQRLKEAGRDVPALLLIDSFAPRPMMSDRATDEDLLEWFARDLLGERGQDWRSGVGEASIESLASRGVVPEGMSELDARRAFAVYQANARAARLYAPGYFDGDVTLFLASEAPPDTFRQHPALRNPAIDDPTGGWSQYSTRTVEVVNIPGDHYTIFEPENVGRLARAIEDVVERASARAARPNKSNVESL